MIDVKILLVLDSNTCNHLTVSKQISSNNSFKNEVTNKLFPFKSYIWKQELELIIHKD